MRRGRLVLRVGRGASPDWFAPLIVPASCSAVSSLGAAGEELTGAPTMVAPEKEKKRSTLRQDVLVHVMTDMQKRMITAIMIGI